MTGRPIIRYHQRSRAKGSRQPPNTLYCGRPGRYGNEFTGRDKAEAARLYRERLLAEIAADPQAGELMKARLRRYDFLSCWCRPGTPCHVQDTLLEIANAPTPESARG